MVKVKSVTLQNYCGYENVHFDFSGKRGVKGFAVFFGPNGCGKSTILNAIRMCGQPEIYLRRLDTKGEPEINPLLRSSIYDVEYLPSIDAMSNKRKNDMLVETVFVTDDGEKKVVIDNFGTLVNELPKSTSNRGHVYFADADHPMSTQKFMLAAEQEKRFLDFCRAVYGYECELSGYMETQGLKIFTDFIVRKGKTKVHFKRMSAGERKIATLVSDICQPINTESRDIVLVDNVELHVYHTRHAKMIDKLIEAFPDKQIFTTTHSSHVINHVNPFYHYDIQEYRPDYRLMEDVEGAISASRVQ